MLQVRAKWTATAPRNVSWQKGRTCTCVFCLSTAPGELLPSGCSSFQLTKQVCPGHLQSLFAPCTEPQVTPSHTGSAGWQCLRLHLPNSLWNPDPHLGLLFAPWGIQKGGSVATCARPDSPFPSPVSLEDEGTSSRTRWQAEGTRHPWPGERGAVPRTCLLAWCLACC